MYTARGIFHASYVVCLLATAVKITSVTNTYYCVYIVETPDDGQQICPKNLERYIKNKFEKECIRLAFLIRTRCTISLPQLKLRTQLNTVLGAGAFCPQTAITNDEYMTF